MALKNYRELKVWQKAYQLTLEIYRITTNFPSSEQFSLVQQLRRSAVSIVSNIGEGYGRRNLGEYAYFISLAYSSCAELETQILLSKDLKFVLETDFELVFGLQQEVSKMLYRLLEALEKKKLT